MHQLGEEFLRRINAWGINTAGVTSGHPTKPTGLNRVTSINGNPQFEIARDVAWDWIEVTAPALEFAADAAAVVFGSLAQRGAHNREQLLALLDRCPAAIKVFDVNLRPPYDSRELIWLLAKHADIIKLNIDELNSLMDASGSRTDWEGLARDFASRAKVGKVCLTAGAAGAGLLFGNDWLWEAGKSVQVRDTVGAGDAFLASLLCDLLEGNHPPPRVLRRACRLAEFVATQDGATPVYEPTMSWRSIERK